MCCPNCGTRNPEDAKYCVKCGYNFSNVTIPGGVTSKLEPVADPVSPVSSPSDEPHPARTVKSKKDRKNPYLIPVVIALVIIIVGLVLMVIPVDNSDDGEVDDYALVTFTVYNDRDETLNISLKGGDVTYFSPVDLNADYFQYGLNFYIVELDGDSDTITFTATGVGSLTGATYTDSETLTLHSGQQYRIVLHL